MDEPHVTTLTSSPKFIILRWQKSQVSVAELKSRLRELKETTSSRSQLASRSSYLSLVHGFVAQLFNTFCFFQRTPVVMLTQDTLPVVQP